MTHENNLVTVSQFDGNAYKSSQAAELTLNAAILHAEIARSEPVSVALLRLEGKRRFVSLAF